MDFVAELGRKIAELGAELAELGEGIAKAHDEIETLKTEMGAWKWDTLSLQYQAVTVVMMRNTA